MDKKFSKTRWTFLLYQNVSPSEPPNYTISLPRLNKWSLTDNHEYPKQFDIHVTLFGIFWEYDQDCSLYDTDLVQIQENFT